MVTRNNFVILCHCGQDTDCMTIVIVCHCNHSRLYTPCSRDHWLYSPKGSSDAAQGSVDRKNLKIFPKSTLLPTQILSLMDLLQGYASGKNILPTSQAQNHISLRKSE